MTECSKLLCISLIDCISDARFQGCTDVQSLVECILVSTTRHQGPHNVAHQKAIKPNQQFVKVTWQAMNVLNANGPDSIDSHHYQKLTLLSLTPAMAEQLKQWIMQISASLGKCI